MLPLDQLQAGLVLPIDKPRQWTSFQAVNKVKSTLRRLYGVKNIKIGHAGTLDPLATGLLLVCIGRATKTIAELQDGDKVYTGTMVFGATTPCYDMEQAIDRRFPYSHITPTLLDTERHLFEGEILQVPPMFSAVKVDGQRAYLYARNDDPSVTIQPKTVCIHSFEITAFRASQSPAKEESPVEPTEPTVPTRPKMNLYDNPQCVIPAELPQADFRISCGKGTYIRSIARDFGAALGSGAFLAALRREQVGRYSVADALTLDQVEPYLASLCAC